MVVPSGEVFFLLLLARRASHHFGGTRRVAGRPPFPPRALPSPFFFILRLATFFPVSSVCYFVFWSHTNVDSPKASSRRVACVALSLSAGALSRRRDAVRRASCVVRRRRRPQMHPSAPVLCAWLLQTNTFGATIDPSRFRPLDRHQNKPTQAPGAIDCFRRQVSARPTRTHAERVDHGARVVHAGGATWRRAVGRSSISTSIGISSIRGFGRGDGDRARRRRRGARPPAAAPRPDPSALARLPRAPRRRRRGRPPRVPGAGRGARAPVAGL